MKKTKASSSSLLFFVIFGLSPAPLCAAESIITRVVAGSESNYCHLRFPAIRPETLYSDRPVLKDPGDGDIIDFYGPCDYDPLGKEQKRMLLGLLTVFLLVSIRLAEAAQPENIPRIGYLTNAPLSPNQLSRHAFREGLRELGYVEGKNIVIEWRFAPKDLRGAAYVFAYMADSLWQ